jgi:hypothetical protein
LSSIHVVGVGHEDLAARAVRNIVDAELDALHREALLHLFEAAAAEGRMVDDAGSDVAAYP